MKIGIFGGCFNPPHNMHRDIALQLLDKGYLDKVIYVPTATFYKKDGIIDFEDRYKMLQLLTDKFEGLEVSRIGSEEKGEFTYQVLDYFKDIYQGNDIYFICGIDNLSKFDSWKNYEYILENYKLLVVDREGFDKEEQLKKYAQYREHILFATINPVKLASTSIRSSIKNNQYEEIANYLDKEVLDYLIYRNLYR